jgi:predicted nucleotidyltransferase
VIGASERRYVRTHWPLLDALTRVLRTEKNIRLAVLYGSAARGDDRAGSDVDLLVSLEDDRRGGLPLARLGLKLEAELGRPVQIILLGDAESSPALLFEAVVDGRPIVDREGMWHGLKGREPTLRRRARAEARHAQVEAWKAMEDLGSE